MADVTRPPADQCRHWIADNISLLRHADVKEVMKVALRELPGKKFITSNDGTRISLDSSVPDEVIFALYDCIQSKLVFFEPKQYEAKK